MNTAEQFAEDYLKEHSLRPERFSKKEMRLGKTPDFRVFKQADLVAYCEAKHVQHDDWLDEQWKEAQPLQIVGGSRPDPIFNRIGNHIHEAVQQFNAVNPEHTYPNVLVFANSDSQCSAEDLRSVLTGEFRVKGGAAEKIYEQYSDGRIRNEKFVIDMYIWWDSSKPADKFSRYSWKESKHREALRELLPR